MTSNMSDEYMEHNRKQRIAFEARRQAAVETLINFFIDTRGCSRLIACGYAKEAIEKRYQEISDNVNQR